MGWMASHWDFKATRSKSIVPLGRQTDRQDLMTVLGFLAPNLGACPPRCHPRRARVVPREGAGWPPPASDQAMVSSGQDGSTWKKKGQLLIHSSCRTVEADGEGTKAQNHITSGSPALPASLLQHPGEQPMATQPGEPASGPGAPRAALRSRLRHAQPYQGTGFRGGDPSSPAWCLSVPSKATPSSSQAIISPARYFHPHVCRL